MFSGKRNALRNSAAWRIAAWPAVAFAVGVALALSTMYVFIARDIRARSDAWLSGEAETLADVSANTPRDNLYGRLVEEVAELATREVSDASLSGQQQNSVFFLQTQPNEGTDLGRTCSQATIHRGYSIGATGARDSWERAR